MGFIFNQAEIEINNSTLDLSSGDFYAHLVTVAPSVAATVTGELVVPDIVNYSYKTLSGLDYVPNLKWSFANVTWPTLTYTAAPVGVVICKQLNATPSSLDRVICFNETSQTLSTGTYSLTQYFILTGIIQLAVDPYINSVFLHILFEGNDNSTTFADIHGNTVLIRDGAPVIKTNRSLYGRGSLYLNGSSSLKVLQSHTFAATVQDFSLEFILYPTTITTSGIQGLFDTRDSISNNPHLVFINNNNSVKGVITNRTNINSNNVNSIVGLKANEWQKLSICRYQGYTTIYINDIPVASEADTNNYTAWGDLIIGDILDTSSPFDGRFVGYLQSIRLTVGVARLTSQYSNSNLSNGDKGDITLTNNGATWTIDDSSVTFSKVQTISNNTLLGRYSSGTGVVQSITIGNNLQLLGGTLVGVTNLIPSDVRDSLQTLTGVNRLDNAYIKNGSPYFTPTDIRGALESLTLNNRLDATYIKNIPVETYSTPTSLRNSLQSLTGTDRLDASAIQNGSPYITALDLRDGLQTLSGANRLDALYIKNLPTGTSTYTTPDDVRDALQTLSGASRLDASAIQNLPTSGSSAYTQATAPTGTPAGTIWIDTSTNVITGWQLISANYAVQAGDKLVIDCTNPITLLLPANPVSGTEFELTKYAGLATVSIDTNGKNFNGSVPVKLRYTGNSAIADTSDKLVYINSAIGWISTRKQVKPAVTLTYVNDGDTNGLVYYLGTNALLTTFTNPGNSTNFPVLASSTGNGTPVNTTDRIVNEWHSTDIAGSWIAWDVGNNYTISIAKYTLRNRSVAVTSLMRNWVLEGSNLVSSATVANYNAATWTTIDARTNDATLTSLNQYYTLTANSSTDNFRYLRLRQTGLTNTSNNFLCLGEIEFYGTLSFN